MSKSYHYYMHVLRSEEDALPFSEAEQIVLNTQTKEPRYAAGIWTSLCILLCILGSVTYLLVQEDSSRDKFGLVGAEDNKRKSVIETTNSANTTQYTNKPYQITPSIKDTITSSRFIPFSANVSDGSESAAESNNWTLTTVEVQARNKESVALPKRATLQNEESMAEKVFDEIHPKIVSPSVLKTQASSLVLPAKFVREQPQGRYAMHVGLSSALVRSTVTQTESILSGFLSGTINISYVVSSVSSFALSAGVESFQIHNQFFVTQLRDTVLYDGNEMPYATKIEVLEEVNECKRKPMLWLGLSYRYTTQEFIQDFNTVGSITFGSSQYGAIARESIGLSRPLTEDMSVDVLLDFNQLFTHNRIISSAINGSVSIMYKCF